MRQPGVVDTWEIFTEVEWIVKAQESGETTVQLSLFCRQHRTSQVLFFPPFFSCLLKGSGFLFVFPALVIRSSLAACWDSSGEWSRVYVFSMCGLRSGTPRPRLCACECLCVHAVAVQAGSDFSRWVWLWAHVCHRTGDQSAGSLFLVLQPPNALLIHSMWRVEEKKNTPDRYKWKKNKGKMYKGRLGIYQGYV